MTMEPVLDRCRATTGFHTIQRTQTHARVQPGVVWYQIKGRGQLKPLFWQRSIVRTEAAPLEIIQNNIVLRTMYLDSCTGGFLCQWKKPPVRHFPSPPKTASWKRAKLTKGTHSRSGRHRRLQQCERDDTGRRHHPAELLANQGNEKKWKPKSPRPKPGTQLVRFL